MRPDVIFLSLIKHETFICLFKNKKVKSNLEKFTKKVTKVSNI